MSNSQQRQAHGLMELVLGTAQFDSRYGRFRGGVDSEGLEILKLAQDLGFSAVDTAPLYAGAEQLIGQFKWRAAIHTKIPPATDPSESLRVSLQNLETDSVEVLYFHDPAVLGEDARFFRSVRRKISRGQVKKLGVSVYSPRELEKAINLPEIEAIQLPLNVADRRLSNDLLDSASERGIALYARSVFLQGALLQSDKSLPGYLSALSPEISRLKDVSTRSGRSIVELAIGWVKAFPQIKGILLGPENKAQLRQLVSSFHTQPLSLRELEDLSEAQLDSELVLDPRNWPR